MEIIKAETHFNFVRLMKPAVILSVAVIIIGIASLIWHGGPNYGIDFAGGTLIQVKFQNEVQTDKIRAVLSAKNLTNNQYLLPYSWLGGQVAPGAPLSVYGQFAFKF